MELHASPSEPEAWACADSFLETFSVLSLCLPERTSREGWDQHAPDLALLLCALIMIGGYDVIRINSPTPAVVEQIESLSWGTMSRIRSYHRNQLCELVGGELPGELKQLSINSATWMETCDQAHEVRHYLGHIERHRLKEDTEKPAGDKPRRWPFSR